MELPNEEGTYTVTLSGGASCEAYFFPISGHWKTARHGEEIGCWKTLQIPGTAKGELITEITSTVA